MEHPPGSERRKAHKGKAGEAPGTLPGHEARGEGGGEV